MSKRNIIGICSLLLVFSLFVLSSTLPAAAQGGALDGKTFVGRIGEKGKKGDKDEFIFKEGTFESKAFEKFGFGSAPYTTKASGDNTTFQAETSNDKGGKMKWDGTVTGNRIGGTTTLNEEGKASVTYWFTGKISMEMPTANMPETPKVDTPEMPKVDMPEVPK